MSTQTQHSDVLIIGGGAIGLSAAYYLNAAGLKVTILEKKDIGAGSSYGNAGLVGPRYFVPLASPGVVKKALKWMWNPESPFYIKPRFSPALISWLWKFNAASNAAQMQKALPVLLEMNVASLQFYEQIMKTTGLDFQLRQNGLLMLYKTPGGEKDVLSLADLARKYGLEARNLKADEIAVLEPAIQPLASGAVYFVEDANITPHLFLKNMGEYLRSKGVAIYIDTEVLGFAAANGKIDAVKTAKGDYHAKEVVIAGGAWSANIVKDLRIKLMLQPAKGYGITVKQPAKALHIPMLLAEAKIAITPMGNQLRFAGTLELSGLDTSINQRRVNAILRTVPQYLANIQPDQLGEQEIWSGMRPCSPDGLPYIGRFPRYQNLIAATGHAMIGISLAPVSGKLIAEIVQGEKSSIDLDPLRVERFGR